MITADGWKMEWVIAERIEDQPHLPGRYLCDTFADPSEAHLAYLELRKWFPRAGFFRVATDLAAVHLNG